MQHAGPNARRAGVGLLHVASETAESSGGGRGVGGGCRCWVLACGDCCGGDVDDGGLAVLRGCSWLAGSGERARRGPARELCRGRRAGEAWQRLARVEVSWWWAVEQAVGE